MSRADAAEVYGLHIEPPAPADRYDGDWPPPCLAVGCPESADVVDADQPQHGWCFAHFEDQLERWAALEIYPAFRETLPPLGNG